MYIEDIPERPTQAQLRLLRVHLPYSLAVLRRLQVAAGAFDGINADGTTGSGTSAYAHVLFAYDGGSSPSDAKDVTAMPFAAAFVDFSKTPETATWIYASDQAEDHVSPGGTSFYAADNDQPDTWVVDRGAQLVADWSAPRRARCRRLVLALLRYMRALARAVAPELAPQLLSTPFSDTAAADLTVHVKANIHDGVRYLLQTPAPDAADDPDRAAVTLSYHDVYDKWLFRSEDLPVLSPLEDTVYHVPALNKAAAPRGNNDEQGTGTAAQSASAASPTLAWDRVHTSADAALVISRTSIPRTTKTLLSVLSVALREEPKKDESGGHAGGTLQAWAFLGVDGSLWTLHTEPAYRGRGVAKTLAARLLRQYGGVFDAVVEGGGEGEGDGDGWCAADVSATNRQSQGVCRRLGAKRTWATAWIKINYDSLGDDE